jgi:hypothetical protein
MQIQKQIQNQNNEIQVKMLPTITTIMKEEGWLAFWKGVRWRVIISGPQFIITLIVFEYLQSLFQIDDL